MDSTVIALPDHATILDACQLLIRHRFLALPVVDEQQRLCGLVDIALLNEENPDLRQRNQADALFETLGFHVTQVGNASPLWAFRLRVPWLLATIASGTLCALLASLYELTPAKSIVLAFFLTLVLGLGESVSMQSMSVTIQALRSVRPNLSWYLRSLRHELPTALLLGLSVPTLLHALRLDPKIAAGPVTLAVTDLCTLLFNFSLPAWLPVALAASSWVALWVAVNLAF